MAIFTIKRNVSLKRFLCPDDTSGLTIIGENGAHRFVIHSLDAPFDGIVTAYFVRSDGTTVFMEGEIVGGMAVVVLHEDCYHVTGKFDISIFITKDGKSTCVYKGKGKVVQYRTDTVDDSGQIIDLGALLEVIDDYEQATLEAQISAGHAADSEANAKASEEAANESERNADASKESARQYAENARQSAESAKQTEQEISGMGDEALEAIAEAKTDALQSVNGAGNEQTGRVNTAGQNQYTAITEAGAEIVQAVNQEGQTQVSAVTSEGTRQKADIEEVGQGWVEQLEGSGDDLIAEHVADLVLSQDMQPDNRFNKVWLKPSENDLVLAELADVQGVANDVNNLKNAIEKNYVKLEPGVNILNAYDNDRTLANKYVTATNGRVSTNNGWLSFLFPVNGGAAISCRQVKNAHLSFYSEDTPSFSSLASGTYLNGYISGFSPTTTVENYEVPIMAKYMCVSVPESRQGSVMVSYSTDVLPYEPYKEGVHYSLILDPPEIPGAVETVEYNIYTDGTGDFANLKECLISIPAETSQDFDANKFYIINLYPGTHDIIAMYGGESELSANGLFLRPNTKIRGIGDKHNIIISGERTTPSNTWSVFNIRNYADIENLTIKSKNARYTIHDDWQTAINAESYRHFKDVIFVGENCQYGSVYGSGLKGHSDWEFINCEFDASKAAANGTPGNTFSLHNNNNVTTPSFVKFRNCRHVNGSGSYKTFRLLSMTTGSENGTVTVTLEGNKIDGIRLSENDASQYGAGCSFWVTGFGNVNPLGVSVVSTDGVDHSDHIDLI